MSILLLASGNAKKRAELERCLTGGPYQLRTLADYPDVPEAPEDGATFAENARAKALWYAARTGALCLADDSGLVVDALDGAPGVYSARYAGVHGDDAANNARLLRELEGVPAERRTARFRCAIALAEAGEIRFEAAGETEGRILDALHGTGGFGYDPLFFSSDLQCSFAEATAAEKDRVGHRGRALAQLRAFLGGEGAPGR